MNIKNFYNMEKINIAKILNSCPKGMELDCTMYEDVYFDYVDELNIIHCYVQHENYKTSITFNQHGTPNSDIKSKCVIFPKGKTTWEEFQRPFKDGDIISGVCFDAICIFKDEGIIKGTVNYYCGICCDDELIIKDVKNQAEHFGDINEYNLATEGEKEILFEAIKNNGYVWNPETKTLEKIPKIKNGDIIYTKTYYSKWISIFEKIDNDKYKCYAAYCIGSDTYYGRVGYKNPLCEINDIVEQRLATEEEKAKLFQVIKDNGHTWNPETKTLEKLIQPKFKVGDKVKSKMSEKIFTIIDIKYDVYIFSRGNDMFGYHVPFRLEKDYELIPNKFDINTLKPLKSEVLVRDTADGMWRPSFWGKYLEDSNYSYLTTNGCYKQCIPYEDNEHLLGTTDDCDEYFKNW